MTPPESFTGNGPVNSLSFSSQDDALASGGDDGKVRIWKLNATDLYDTYAPFIDKYTYPSIQAVAFQPGGSLLAIATVKEATTELGHVILYDYLQKSRVADLDCGPVNCSSLAWSPDAKTLAAAGTLGIWIYNATALDSPPRLLEGHTRDVLGVAFSAEHICSTCPRPAATRPRTSPTAWPWLISIRCWGLLRFRIRC